jgi:hypothetical protein
MEDYNSKGPHSTASFKCLHKLQYPPFLQPPGGGRCWILFRRVRKIAKSDYCLRYVCLSVCLSVRPSVRMELGSRWTDSHKI